MNFTSFDKRELFLHVWEDVAHPRGVVQIVHGMAEHGARYEEFAKFLNENGYIVVADDHRGHGKTAETLGWCSKDMFADCVKDEVCITQYLKKKYALPCFVLGFSFGSFLTQSYLAQGEKIAGAVIAGSSYKKDFEVYLGSVVARLGIIFCGEKKPARLIERLSFGAYAKKFADGEWLSTDADNNAAYHGDALCGFTCSFRFYSDFFRGLRSLYTKKYRAALCKDLPLLLVSGEDDPVGNMGKGVKKLRRFYEDAGMQSVEMHLFPHSRHEFLNERESRKERWEMILKFFDENCR